MALAAVADTAPKKRLQQINTEMKQLDGVLKTLQSSRSTLQKQLAQNEQSQGTLTQKIHQNQTQLERYKARIKTISAREKSLQQQKQQQQAHLAAVLRNRYIQGDKNGLRLWLNQGENTHAERDLLYYQYLYRAQIQQLESYNHTLENLHNIEQEHDRQYQRMQASQKALHVKKQALLQQEKKRRTTLRHIQARWRKKNQRLADITAQKAELTKVLDSIVSMEMRLPSGKPFSSARGKLAWPVVGRVVKTFARGQRNDLTAHGILIKAKAGTAVRAIYHGQVVFANWLRGYGLVMIIDHGGGYLSLYAHNQALLKDAGEWVQSGDSIARVGRTGGQSQAALYFELRKKGKPYNPLPWMKKR